MSTLRSGCSSLVVFGALLLSLGGCASDPDSAPVRVELLALDEGAYAASVHSVVEMRCGSGACHGQLPRGLRVYGAHALRGVAGTDPNAPPTPDEIRATFESIVGLEPERLRDFLSSPTRSPEEATRLTFLSKPLALERHRGGVALIPGDPADRCLSTWLAGRLDRTACANATPMATVPP